MFKTTGPANPKFMGVSRLPSQYGLRGAWQRTRGAASFPLGLVSGGIRTDCPDLDYGRITMFCARTDVGGDATENSVTNFAAGTALAAQMVGYSANGVCGVAPQASLAVARAHIGTNYSEAPAAFVATGIRQLADFGCRVIAVPLIWGYATPDQGLKDALDYAWAAGCLCVVSAGSRDATGGQYPGAWSTEGQIVTVGSYSASDQHSGAMARLGHRWLATNASSRYGPTVSIVGSNSAAVVEYDFTFGKWIRRQTVFQDQLMRPACGVAAVAHLIWAANPSLTNAQVRDVLLTTMHQPWGDWRSTAYVSAGVGYPNAERGVLKALSMAPANAGVVFPWLNVSGAKKVDDDVYMADSPTLGFTVADNGTESTLTFHGEVELEAGGYCNGQEVSSVEVWISGSRIYHGTPVKRSAGSVISHTEYRTQLHDTRVVATASTGQVGTLTLPTTGQATGAVRTILLGVGEAMPSPTYPTDTTWEVLVPASGAAGTYEAVASTGETASVVVPPPFALRTVEADAAVRERHLQTLSSDADVALRLYLARSPWLGRSFFAGPLEPVDSFMPKRTKPLAADASVANRVSKSAVASAVVAQRLRAQAPADAAVSQRFASTVAAGAWVAGTLSRTVVASATVSGSGVSTATAGALVRWNFAQAVDAGGLVATRQGATLDSDAAVQAAGSASVPAGAVVRLPGLIALTAVADSVVQGRSVATVGADASVYVAGSVLKNVVGQALVKGARAATATADAFIQHTGFGRVALIVEASASVQAATTKTVTAQAYIAQVGTVARNIVAAALVRGAFSRSLDGDAAVRTSGESHVPADGIVLGSMLATVEATASVAASEVRELASSACVAEHIHIEPIADAYASPAAQVVASGFVVDLALSPEWDVDLELVEHMTVEFSTFNLSIEE